MTKKTKVKKEKIVKVEMVLPKIEIAPETYKQDPVEQPESKPLPVEKEKKPVINPNDPEMVGIDTGFKKPSITNVKSAFTAKQYKVLMENYDKENPAKYRAKKSELERKLKELK